MTLYVMCYIYIYIYIYIYLFIFFVHWLCVYNDLRH